jgi:hypothetical protein
MGGGTGTGSTRKIHVSLEYTNLNSLPDNDDGMYVYLFLNPTAEGKRLEGTVISKSPFKTYPDGLVERASLQDLSVIETLAERNGAIVDYTPVVMQALEEHALLENERKCYDEGSDCCSD